MKINFSVKSASHPKGQTLVIVLLAMVASLTVGLAVSTRTISTLRQTTFTSQASGVLAAAEAGAEEALKRLADSTDSCSNNVISSTTSCTYSGVTKTYTAGPCLPLTNPKVFSASNESQAQFSYCVAKGGSSGAYQFDMEKDKTVEIKINQGQDYSESSVNFCWFKNGLDSAPHASVEIIVVGANSLLGKFAYNPLTQAQDLGNGFSGGEQNGADGTFENCVSVPVPAAKIMRVRALYNNVTGEVLAVNGKSLPFQSYQIESVGALGDVLKKVRVTKSLPALPTIFDFGLFSGSQTQPIQSQ